MAKDVVTFLHWAAEPEHDERKKIGLKAVILFSALTVISLYVKRAKWAGIKTRKICACKSNGHFTSSSTDFFYQYTLLRWTNTINLVVLEVYYSIANINYYSSTLHEPRGCSRYGNIIPRHFFAGKGTCRVTHRGAGERLIWRLLSGWARSKIDPGTSVARFALLYNYNGDFLITEVASRKALAHPTPSGNPNLVSAVPYGGHCGLILRLPSLWGSRCWQHCHCDCPCYR